MLGLDIRPLPTRTSSESPSVKPLKHLALSIGLIVALVALSEAFGQTRQPELEAASEAAVAYLQAYFRGDAERVVDLIHPQTLAEGKHQIVAQYEMAVENGTLARFQETLGLEGDPAELVHLDAAELYARLIEAEHEDLSPSERAALYQTRLLVEDAQFVDEDTARVSITLLGPGPQGYIEQTTVVDMALREGRWLVVGDSPQP